jgi:hypothetical protein
MLWPDVKDKSVTSGRNICLSKIVLAEDGGVSL